MDQLIFSNPPPFAKWIIRFFCFGAVCLAVGLIFGGAMHIFSFIGGLWLLVAAFVSVVIAFAGRGQITEMRRAGENLTVRTVRLFGPARSFTLSTVQAQNWQWLTQGGDKYIGPRLIMLAFDHAGRTYRLPLSTAKYADIPALHVLAPQVVDDLLMRYPGLRDSWPNKK